MGIRRRIFLSVSIGIFALSNLSVSAEAQTYPSQPVRMVVGFSPGGVADINARLIAQYLSEKLGQQFLVDNRTGAGGSIAADSVVRAAPDGYTLLLTTASDSFNTALYERLSFEYPRDVELVAGISQFAGALVVNPAFPAKTVPEFIAHVKANPGKITMASAGVGSAPHVWWELFKSAAGVNMVHVPYRGEGPALPDLIGGQVQAMIPTIPGSIEFIKTGKLRALAVTSAVRAEALPDVPSLADFVPGYDAVAWVGIAVPRDTPNAIVEKLNREINAGLADPRLKSRIAELSGRPFTGSKVEFGTFVAAYTDKWAKVIRSANVKAE